MRRILTAIIEEGSPADATVKAFGEDTANIFIKAASLDEALQLVPGAEQDALEACKNWKPEEVPQEEEPKKHYIVSPVATEDIEETIQDFEESEKGRRFVKVLENAKDFTSKKDKHGMLITEFKYLLALTYKEAYSGLLTMYDYAYRKGYNRAIKNIKDKQTA